MVNVVPQRMGMVVKGGLCFRNGLTTCTLSSFRGHIPTPMPTTTSASTTTSTRYRLPGTPITANLPTIVSRITITTITITTRITITTIVITTIIIITTTIITRFKIMSISPEISIIITLVLVCKVINGSFCFYQRMLSFQNRNYTRLPLVGWSTF